MGLTANCTANTEPERGTSEWIPTSLVILWAQCKTDNLRTSATDPFCQENPYGPNTS